MQFFYTNPTKIFFGEGQIAQIKSAIPKNAKVLFVFGGGSIKKNGVYEQVIDALSSHTWFEFSGIEPNPKVQTLDKAVAIVKKENIDFILAVGGGSVIDGCKYIAAAGVYDGVGWDILAKRLTVTEAIPLGAVLTLPATGSESNGGAVITNGETHDKLAFQSLATYPTFAVLDPSTMFSLPEKQLANGIADAFVHTCEQYLTYPTATGWVQDGYAETLLKNLVNLAKTFDNRDINWHTNLMWTANQALNGLIGRGVPNDWATHMLGHELTAMYGVDHALSLTIIQPALLKIEFAEKKSKLEQMGQNVFGLKLDVGLAENTITEIENLYHSINLATNYNLFRKNKEADIEVLIEKLEAHGMLKLGEKGLINLDVSRKIYELALN